MIIVNNPTSTAAGKNYFKNPAFSVIQGTASGTLANSLALPTASLGYLGETEWCIAASGGTPAYAFSSLDERVTFTGAASTTAIYLLQRLESRDTNRLKDKTVSFSFETSNSLLTSLTWEIFRPTTSDDVHGTIASPTQTLIASGTITINSTLTRYSVTAVLPSEASRGLEIRLRVGAQTSGTWVVARLQLEEGSTATDFNCGDYAEELMRCRRYSEILRGSEIQFNGYARGTTTAGVVRNFSVPKFLNPVFSDLGSNYVIQAGAGVVAVTNFSVAYSTKEAIHLDISCASGLTQGQGSIVRNGDSVTSVIGFLAHIP